MDLQHKIQNYSNQRFKKEFLSLELIKVLMAFFIYKNTLFWFELILFILICWLKSFELSRKFSKLYSASKEIDFHNDLKLPISDSNNIDVSTQNLVPEILKESTFNHIVDCIFVSGENRLNFENRFRENLCRCRIFILVLYLLFKKGKTHSFSPNLYLSTSLIPDFIFNLYANAKLILLIEKLAKIKVAVYEEAVDVDEFDEEAPPPSVSVPIGPISIIKCMTSLALGKSSQWLTWERPLVLQLSSCSVMAFLDRSGPISEAFPLPVELTQVSMDNLIRYPITAHIGDKKIDLNFEEPIPHEIASVISFFFSCYDSSNSHSALPHIRTDWKDSVNGQTCFCIFEKSLKGKPNIDSLFVKRVFKKDSCEFMLVECICKENNDESFRIVIVCGDSPHIARLSKYYWDAGADAIRELSQDLRSDLLAYNSFILLQDAQPISIAFIPLFETETIDDNLVDLPFIWVSNLSLASTPKEEMAELVRDLGGAGIRFVYFSPLEERMTKAFADRLELETDWNSCIILSEPTYPKGAGALNNFGYSAISDIKARLPRGVHSIRKHLIEVDDIPLHVSTFAECQPDSSCEMLRIYYENGETVTTVSSILNNEAYQFFGVCSLCIGMESCLKEAQSFASTLAFIPYSFLIPFEASPYVFTDIIKEARQLNRRMENFLYFSCFYLAMLSFCRVNHWESSLLIIACLVFQRNRIPVLKEMPEKRDFSLYTRKFLFLKFLFFGSLLPCYFFCKYPLPLVLLLHYSIVNYQVLTLSPLAIWLNYFFGSNVQLNIWDIRSMISFLMCFGFSYYANNKLEHKYEKQQKRAKLVFNTKLGMHSPV
jgi:hypothetical protein